MWLRASDVRLADLAAVVEVPTDAAAYPMAQRIECGVVVYAGAPMRGALADPIERRRLQAELVNAFRDGPGIVLIESAFDDSSVVDQVSAAFRAMIDAQRQSGRVVGDHFAAVGANDRVWNALEKLAVGTPDAFAAYYANDIIDLVASAWLGPGYQITSQVNVVNPGGAAQEAHCDYHLGFMTDEAAEQFPAHVHRLSPALTLQGAIAHVDMPVASGPTMYLPHSQKYELGYLAGRRPEVREYFGQHHVQLALTKGDAVFFNPALLHAAGHNRSTDCRRMANLLQISSPFGRAMESVDRVRMCAALHPALAAMRDAGAPLSALRNVLAAAAEGYAFPTNLDRDPPVEGLAPASQAAMMERALVEEWDHGTVVKSLQGWGERRLTDDQ